MHLRCRGFSLLEMLLIVAIVLIIAGIAVPRYFDNAAQSELDTEARQLAGDLQWSMQVAAASTAASTVKIVFANSSPFGYTIVQGAAEAIIRPPRSFPVTVLLPNTQKPVVFDVYGRPQDGNDINVTLRNTRGHSRLVRLDYLTRQVQVQ